MSIFIGIYLVFVAVFAVMGAIGVYHALRYGFRRDATRPMTALFLIIGMVMIIISALYVFNVAEWPL